MTDGMVRVRLLAFPLALYRESQEHHEELMREFALLALSSTQDDVPKRLRDLVAALRAKYATATQAADAARDEALELGHAYVDLEYVVPPAAREACVALDAMLDEADGYCRAGDRLLTLAAPPGALAFRKWYLGEFVAQIDGAAPTPWRDSARAT